MPEGSSSAAPVITPGPRTEKKRRMTFFFGCGAGLFGIVGRKNKSGLATEIRHSARLRM